MIWVIGLLAVCGLVPEAVAHDRPIVGVLVQEISRVFELMYPRQYTSFIAASYVKWLESGGARVVPIFPGRDISYYQTILSKLNGVLLPGGSVDKNDRGGYTEAAENILNIAIDMNLKKDFFPVFGVGLGMDFMLYKSGDAENVHSDCSLDSVALSLILSKKGDDS